MPGSDKAMLQKIRDKISGINELDLVAVSELSNEIKDLFRFPYQTYTSAVFPAKN
jgi:hypothetical protein